jgi:outer membrane protein TolC
MILSRNKGLIILVILSLLLIFSNSAFAQELTFKEGINLGLKNNIELVRMQKNLEQLKRNLEKTKASSGWQVDTNAKAQISNFINDRANNNEDDKFQEFDLSVLATKNYWSGLTLKPEVYDEAQFQLSLTQDLYPRIPIKSEQSYIKQKLELRQTQAEFQQKVNSKIITWAEDYLNLIRLKESYNVAKQKYKLTQKKLDEVLAKQKIDEAGELELLSAKANLKEAQYNLKNAESNYKEAKRSLANELGISKEDNLALMDNSKYLIQLRDTANSFSIKLDNKDRLVDLAMDNSVELLKNELNKRSSEHELRWSKLANQPDLNLKGKYNTPNEEWSAGVNLSYNIFDSGQQELEIENFTEKIDTIKKEHQDLVKELKLRLDKLVNRLEANQSNLEAKEFSLEKAKLDVEIASRQLERGLLGQLEFLKKNLALEEARVNFVAAKDKLLFSKLKLIEYIGTKDFLGGKN